MTFSKYLLVFVLAARATFAVGTVQQSFQQLGQTTTFVLAVNWTGDSINGTVPATLANLGGLAIQGYRIFSVEVAPGSPAPSTNYSLTLTTFLGTDALAGSGSSLSATLPTTLQAPSTAAPVNGVLTINIAGNSVASAQGRFLIYFAPIFQVMGLPSVNAAGNNTFSGANTFTGTNTFTVAQIFNVGNTFTGSNLFTSSSNGVRPVIIQGDANGLNNTLQIQNTHAGGHTWDIGEMQGLGHLSFRDLTQTGQPIWSFQSTGTVGGEALLTNANTTNRVYFFPDSTGNIPVIPCITSQRTETAADANLLTCAIPAQAGSYRVRFVLNVSAANAATLGWTATWTDSNGNAAAPTNISIFSTSGAVNSTFTISASQDFYGYADVDVNNAGTSIVVKLTFSGTSFTGKASATVERII